MRGFCHDKRINYYTFLFCLCCKSSTFLHSKSSHTLSDLCFHIIFQSPSYHCFHFIWDHKLWGVALLARSYTLWRHISNTFEHHHFSLLVSTSLSSKSEGRQNSFNNHILIGPNILEMSSFLFSSPIASTFLFIAYVPASFHYKGGEWQACIYISSSVIFDSPLLFYYISISW